jgi:mono/diheme cytochrome c family protein
MVSRYCSSVPAAAGVVTALVAATAMLAAEPSAAKSIRDGIYNSAQVMRGQKAYNSLCARCHGETLGGGEDSPALVAEDFLKNWYGKSVGKLVEYTREEMPSDGPGQVTRRQSTDITAFVLSRNDYPAGEGELAADLELLNQILITPKK